MTQLDFSARAYGAGFPPNGENVRVRHEGSRLVIAGASGAERELPLAQVECRAGGWRGDELLLESGTGEERLGLAVRDAAALQALWEQPPAELRAGLEAWRASMRRAHRRWRAGQVAVLGTVALGIALVGYALLRSDRLIEVAVGRIPLAWEERLGEIALIEVAHDARAWREGETSRAVREIGARLAAQAKSPYTFRCHLLDAPHVNAMALPGGTIVVWTGLVRETQNPEELAGVLAHEMQHVVHRDVLRGALRNLGWRATLAILVGGSHGVGRDVAGIVQQLGSLRFSRQQEAEADRGAVQLLQRAGIRPEGLATFFERLSRQGTETPAFLSTHPASEQRAAAVRAAADPLFQAPPLAYDWERVQDELRRGAASRSPAAR